MGELRLAPKLSFRRVSAALWWLWRIPIPKCRGRAFQKACICGRRGVWLGINLFTAFLASWVVGLFEATLDQVVALAVLMPVVASMGGIAGSQTLTLMIRGLALGNITKRNQSQLLRKELGVAVITGLFWSLVVAAVATAWFRDPKIGLVIAIALVINQLFAALSGVLIPLLLKKLGIDPALAGSVILTTVTDIIGFAAFLGLGAIILI